MKRLATLTAALALAGTAWVDARQTAQQTPPPAQTKPEERTEAKAAPATVAGKWNMSVETQNGTNSAVLDIRLDGKKVTGTLSSAQGGEARIEGEFNEGQLKFAMSFEGGSNGPVQLLFSGALKEGLLAGTMDFGGQGLQIPWKAERVKEK